MRFGRVFSSGVVVWCALAPGCNEFTPDGGFPVTAGDGGADADAGPGAATGNDDDAADAADDDQTASSSVPPVGPEMTGLHVVGNQIWNAQGQALALHGVNRSGTEYRCAQGGGIFDGPFDEASIQAIASWKATAVRVPLNESCWLAINGSPAAYSGDVYKQAISAYVALLHKYHIVPILELHWVGPGTSLALRQQPMPDADHAPAFWADVAATFQSDDGVIFEPYNEPFPDSNMETTAAWDCWRDGCTMVSEAVAQGTPPTTYQAAGMQDLVNAIRQAESGVTHVLLLGGVEYSNDLLHWLDHEPADPAASANLGAAWHVYNYNACRDASCWDGAPAAVAAAVPLVATEIGENDCADAFISPLMAWPDGKSSSYLAWSWDAFGACRGSSFDADSGVYTQGNPYSLISDYASGAPDTNSTYAQTYHDHIGTF